MVKAQADHSARTAIRPLASEHSDGDGNNGDPPAGLEGGEMMKRHGTFNGYKGERTGPPVDLRDQINSVDSRYLFLMPLGSMVILLLLILRWVSFYAVRKKKHCKPGLRESPGNPHNG